jgi:hypothetical protein
MGRNAIAGLLMVALLGVSRDGAGEVLPGNSWALLGIEVVGRQGDILAANITLGVPAVALTDVGPKVLGPYLRGSVGFGGAAVGVGVAAFRPFCLHGIPVHCASAGIQGKVLRTSSRSSWPAPSYGGGELTLGYFALRGSVAVLRSLDGADDATRVQVGAGLGLGF